MNFEQNLEELEKIIKEMEDKNTSLDRSLELFNKGVEIARDCSKILENGTGKVEKLTTEINEIKESGEK